MDVFRFKMIPQRGGAVIRFDPSLTPIYLANRLALLPLLVEALPHWSPFGHCTRRVPEAKKPVSGPQKKPGTRVTA